MPHTDMQLKKKKKKAFVRKLKNKDSPVRAAQQTLRVVTTSGCFTSPIYQRTRGYWFTACLHMSWRLWLEADVSSQGQLGLLCWPKNT